MTKNARRNVKYMFGGVVLVLGGALLSATIPDLRRYWRMRNM